MRILISLIAAFILLVCGINAVATKKFYYRGLLLGTGGEAIFMGAIIICLALIALVYLSVQLRSFLKTEDGEDQESQTEHSELQDEELTEEKMIKNDRDVFKKLKDRSERKQQ